MSEDFLITTSAHVHGPLASDLEEIQAVEDAGSQLVEAQHVAQLVFALCEDWLAAAPAPAMTERTSSKDKSGSSDSPGLR